MYVYIYGYILYICIQICDDMMTYNNQSSLCWSVYVSMVLMSVIPTCPQSIPGLDPLWWCLVASMTQ